MRSYSAKKFLIFSVSGLILSNINYFYQHCCSFMSRFSSITLILMLLGASIQPVCSLNARFLPNTPTQKKCCCTSENSGSGTHPDSQHKCSKSCENCITNASLPDLSGVEARSASISPHHTIIVSLPASITDISDQFRISAFRYRSSSPPSISFFRIPLRI